jgi:GTP-binding protein
MLPTFAIVGRPNVGKSTLFNVLTKTRNAIVADEAGLTRDRQIGRGQIGSHEYWVIDTGGLEGESEAIAELVTQQVRLALQESQSVLFLVDGRGGLTAADENIAVQLRQFNIPIHLVINKAENLRPELVSAEFQQLGFEKIYTISAAHRWGIESLMESALALFPSQSEEANLSTVAEGIKIAIVGRPNVGKSTLVNRLLGYERVITFDQPGTTRDSIFIPFERDGQRYTLIDTAGVRRRAKVWATIEKFSVIKALQAIEAAHVVIMVLDAREGITDQDAHLLGHILTSGRSLVIAVNKWDGLEPHHREQVRYHLSRKLHFINFAQIHFISALHGSGVGQLFGVINTLWQAAHQQINTAQLNQVLRQATKAHPPPQVRGRQIKLRYIHQGGHHPPLFVIHGNQVDALPDSYRRYLINTFREVFALTGTPIRLELKSGTNPYEDRKNTLTPRQQRKRQRLLQYVKKSGNK